LPSSTTPSAKNFLHRTYSDETSKWTYVIL
jgi:hypothetical protein